MRNKKKKKSPTNDPPCLCCPNKHTNTQKHSDRHTDHKKRESILEKKEQQWVETDAAADRSATRTESLLLLPESLPLSPLLASSPPPPFLFFFPWNPFHIIKDTQMKWTLRKSGFQRRGVVGVGGRRSWWWWRGREPQPSSPPPSSQWGPTLEGGGVVQVCGTDQYHLRY